MEKPQHPLGYYFYQSSCPEELFQSILCAEEEHRTALLQNPDLFAESPSLLFQNNALGEWLKIRLTRERSLTMNLQIRYPGELLEQYIGLFLPAGRQPWVSENLLSLLIYQILQEEEELRPGFLIENLRQGASPRRGEQIFQSFQNQYLWNFSSSLSELFLVYDFYRAELEQFLGPGGGPHWQQPVWQRIDALGDGRLRWPGKLIRRIIEQQILPAEMPAPVVIIGSSFLKPLEIRFFHYLSRFTGVFHFWLTPTLFPRATAASPIPFRWLKNSLQTIAVLNQLEPVSWAPPAPVRSSPDTSLLERVQLRLRNASAPGGPPEDFGELPLEDGSIRFFSCNDHWREAEVLKDQILALLARDPSLQLNDIAVLAPNINDYKSVIRAVFQNTADQTFLSCNLIDLQSPSQSNYLSALQKLLELYQSPFSLEDVLEFLQNPCCSIADTLTERPADFWRRLFRELRISWGISPEHRLEHAGMESADPPGPELSLQDCRGNGTWQLAAEKLAAGYLYDRDEWDETLDLNDDEAQLASRILLYTEQLYRAVRNFGSRRKTVADWAETLETLQEQFLRCRDPDHHSDKYDRYKINVQLHRLLSIERQLNLLKAGGSGLNQPVLLPFHIISSILQEALAQSSSSLGRYLTQGIACSSLYPNRVVPFRVLCVLGMNESEFPRKSRERSYDLSREIPESLYSSREDQEQHIFSELLISAQERVYFFFRGRDPQRGSLLNPSPFLHELCYYLQQDSDRSVEEIWKTLLEEHPLHSFSAEYFASSPKLFTYSQAAERQLQARQTEPLSSPSPVPDQPAELENLKLSDLTAFLADAPAVHWYHLSKLKRKPYQNLWLQSDLEFEPEEHTLGVQEAGSLIRTLWRDLPRLFRLLECSAPEFERWLLEQNYLLPGPIPKIAAADLYGKLSGLVRTLQAEFERYGLRELRPVFHLRSSQFPGPFQESVGEIRYQCVPAASIAAGDPDRCRFEAEIGPLYYAPDSKTILLPRPGGSRSQMLFFPYLASLSLSLNPICGAGPSAESLVYIDYSPSDYSLQSSEYRWQNGRTAKQLVPSGEELSLLFSAYRQNLRTPLPLQASFLEELKKKLGREAGTKQLRERFSSLWTEWNLEHKTEHEALMHTVIPVPDTESFWELVSLLLRKIPDGKA